jgi:uncharacterized repeat protein (TIGR02543 family)
MEANMKKYKILFLIIAIITLCSVLTACNDPKTAYISFQLDEEFTVEWYNDEPVFEGFPYPSAYLISHKEKPVAILYDFESTSADGPSLNQTKGSKAQTLKFTMFTGHQGKAQPSVVLKVNGKTVEHTVAVFETMQYTEDSADQGWVFYYEKGGYTDSVVLSFEGLLAQPTYLLTFDTNGGTDVVALREHSGNAITAPDDPTKDGYTFDGWFIDDECKNAFEFDVMPASNTTIYAKWNPEQNEV